MPMTMLSLCISVGSSSLRLVIVLKTRNKKGRGLLYTTRATSAIIPRPSVSKRTQRATTRATFTRILSCRSIIVSSTEVGPSNS